MWAYTYVKAIGQIEVINKSGCEYINILLVVVEAECMRISEGILLSSDVQFVNRCFEA